MQERKIIDALLIKMLQEGKNQREAARFFGCSEPAICKKVKRLLPAPALEGLSDKEKKFCVKVAEGQSHTEAAMQSFDCTTRDSAKAIGNALMQKDEINMGIKELMENAGMGRGYRVKKLKGLVDHVNPDISLRALDQSWKLDNSYPPTRSINLNANVDLSPVDLSKYMTED